MADHEDDQTTNPQGEPSESAEQAGAEASAPDVPADVPADATSEASASATPEATAGSEQPSEADEAAEAEMLAMLQGATQAVAEVAAASQGEAFTPPDFGANSSPKREPEGLSMLSDINLDVRIELGRTKMLVEDVLRLNSGSVVELDKLAGDPVDVYVNGRHIAKGEVLVLNDSFCIRVSEIVSEYTDKEAKRANA